jgi:hypothetical protein
MHFNGVFNGALKRLGPAGVNSSNSKKHGLGITAFSDGVFYGSVIGGYTPSCCCSSRLYGSLLDIERNAIVHSNSYFVALGWLWVVSDDVCVLRSVGKRLDEREVTALQV